MFGEPLLAHPTECASVHATWHPHSGEDHNRDQHDDDADDQQHMVLDLAPRGARVGAGVGLVQFGGLGWSSVTVA
jgi:hypothetical protein